MTIPARFTHPYTVATAVCVLLWACTAPSVTRQGGDGDGGKGTPSAGKGGGAGSAATATGGESGNAGSAGTGGASDQAGAGGSTSTGGSAAGAGGAKTGGSGGSGTGSGGSVGTGGAGGTAGSGNMVSFNRDIVPVVIKTCGIVGCHIAGSPEWHGMDLVSRAKIYAAWVGKKGFDHCKEGQGGSAEFPVRITPSKLAVSESYIFFKVAGKAGLCPPDSERMPFPPKEAWTAAQVETLKQWILQGAQNN